jgi:hypothetical protein
VAADPPILEFDPDPVGIYDPDGPSTGADVPSCAVACHFVDLVKRAQQAAETVMRLPSGLPLVRVRHQDRWIGLFYPGQGAPLAAASLERVIAAGCSTIVACGDAGTLTGQPLARLPEMVGTRGPGMWVLARGNVRGGAWGSCYYACSVAWASGWELEVEEPAWFGQVEGVEDPGLGGGGGGALGHSPLGGNTSPAGPLSPGLTCNPRQTRDWRPADGDRTPTTVGCRGCERLTKQPGGLSLPCGTRPRPLPADHPS